MVFKVAVPVGVHALSIKWESYEACTFGPKVFCKPYGWALILLSWDLILRWFPIYCCEFRRYTHNAWVDLHWVESGSTLYILNCYASLVLAIKQVGWLVGLTLVKSDLVFTSSSYIMFAACSFLIHDLPHLGYK